MATELHMDGFVARAARALSQVSIDLVAQRAGIEPEKLKAYERGLGSVTTEEAQALVVAFDYMASCSSPKAMAADRARALASAASSATPRSR